MIRITITGLDFEHDLYALVRSFFPGEETSAVVVEKKEEENYAVVIEAAEHFEKPLVILLPECDRKPDPFSSRLDKKSYVKREVYRSLSKETKKILPWGTLTGIRPAKLVTGKLEEGKTILEAQDDLAREFFVSPSKIALCTAVAENEERILQKIDFEKGYSLYVGIPFCPTRCLYCSFTSYPIEKWKTRVDEYIDALCREIDFAAQLMRGRKLQTIYMGGGTPTTLLPAQMDRLLTKLEAAFSYEHLLEMTVEAGRPDSITKEKLAVLKEHGIERISINPQTMRQKTLDLIGRKHTVEDVVEIFCLARDMGFSNINMDLIMGLPGETLEDVKITLSEIEKLAPDSLTVHSLAVKRAARLNTMRDVYAKYPVMDSTEMIELAQETAGRLGLVPYYLYRQKNMAGNFENVGYATPGKECLYNILIMEEVEDILALGAGGATKRTFSDGRLERCENVKDVGTYLSNFEEMLERKRRLFS